MIKEKPVKISQERVWDSIAGSWNKFRDKPMIEVIDFLKKHEGDILDLGCGSGRHLINISGVRIHCVDFSEEMLKHAEDKATRERINAEFRKSESTNLPFMDSIFDAAIFVSSLHCIETAKDREKALKELLRVLKPGAEALISVWSKNHPRVENKPKNCYIPWTVNGERFLRYYYIYDKEELENLLKLVGFDILRSWEEENVNVIVKKRI